MDMKHILSFLSALFILATAQARCVVFTLSSGAHAYYQLGGTHNPVLRWGNEGVTIDCDAYQLADIRNFYVSDEDAPEGIEAPSLHAGGKWHEGCLLVEAEAGEITVTDLSGRTATCDVHDCGQQRSIDLSRLQPGTYIIKIGNDAIKIIR